MKKKITKKKLLLGVILITALVVALINFFAPSVLYKSVVEGTRFAAGLKVQSIQADGRTYTYLDSHPEGSELPVLVGLHGFSGDKDNWTRMAVFLRGKYRVIAVDMLGHGGSDKPMDVSYKLSDQAKRVHAVLQKMGVNKFHLIGNSMGGQTAGLFVSLFPESVQSVIFVNNAGITSPEDSVLLKRYKATKQNDLLVKKPEDIFVYFDSVFSHQPLMTPQIALYFGERMVEHEEVYEKIFQDFVFDQPEPLEPILPTINVPVQIIWGDEDKVLHVSSVGVMTELLSTERVHIFKGVGHAPMVELPKQTADVVDAFISGLSTQ